MEKAHTNVWADMVKGGKKQGLGRASPWALESWAGLLFPRLGSPGLPEVSRPLGAAAMGYVPNTKEPRLKHYVPAD